VNQCNCQRSGRELQLAGAEGRSIVDVELSWQSPLPKRLGEAVHEGGQPLGRIKPSVGNQPGMVVDEGDQIAFTLFPAAEKNRAVHDIGLPQIVGRFRFEYAPVRTVRRFLAHQTDLLSTFFR
jgi:hypothetical protein